MRQSPSFGHRLLRECLNGGSAGTCDSSRFSIEIDISGKYRKKKKRRRTVSTLSLVTHKSLVGDFKGLEG